MESKEIWGAINHAVWCTTPCVARRLAAEEDVRAGRAVFFLKNHEEIGCVPDGLRLPHLAI
jgi:hypothetical protein